MLHLPPGSHQTTDLVCLALLTTTARLLSPSVTGEASLAVALFLYNLLRKKPEEQALPAGIGFALCSSADSTEGGRWPGRLYAAIRMLRVSALRGASQSKPASGYVERDKNLVQQQEPRFPDCAKHWKGGGTCRGLQPQRRGDTI